jgi:hypothetical protein
VPPFPTIKTPLEEESTHQFHEPFLLPPPGAVTTPWMLPLPLSLSTAWPPEGLRRRRESPPRHAIVLRSFRIPVPRPSTSASRLEMGFRKSSWSPYVCEYVEVPLVRCRSCCSKIFTTLRSATSSSTATLVRLRNPRVSIYEGTPTKLLPLQHY